MPNQQQPTPKGPKKASAANLGLRALIIAAVATTAVAVLSSCSFVKLTEAGEKVDLRENSGTENCKRIGVITVSGVDKVGFINRKDTKVGSELLNQARNDAAGMGANVLVPLGMPIEGKQKFEAYDCP
ncbi:DUF4156 domain-containing protein [Halioxenophilus aromaticivorans]|uniref:DUF4156 domain-containing protein n=1 Tax=Halioxenophilus aromaticivorans TaxID=1306992 RepID=A0AAV3U5N3_9ALTE